MKAVVLTAYGPPEGLRLQEIDKPAPKKGEVLVRVHATTVNAGDSEIRTSSFPWLFFIPLRIWIGLFKPKPKTILGMEFAGVIESVGEEVESFQVGDAVFAESGMGFGSHAEYICVPAQGTMAAKPKSVSFEAAAALPIGGISALGYLRRAGIERGKMVLVRGASGSIGTYAVQLAKHFGAEVTAVCGTQSVERMKALGADVVIDYTQEDFTDNGVAYDIILDVVGKLPISRCLRSLGKNGRYVRATVPGFRELLVALWTAMTSRKRVILGDAGQSAEDLVFLGGLLEAGKLETVIDRRYPLEQVADAHRYVETGHKQGHLIIEVMGNELR